VSSTGTGAGVFQTSPTITTPTIDTITSAASTALNLKSAGTTAVTIDTSQNVGIGTTSPAYKLQVSNTSGYAQIALQGNAVNGGIINFYDSASSVTARILGFGSTAGDPYAMRFDTNGSERLRITSTGQIQLTNSDSNTVNSLKASRFGYSSSYQTVILGSSTGNVTPCINVDLSANNSGSFNGTGGEVAFRNDTIFIQPTSANTGFLNSMRLNNGNVQVYGALSKGSGSFRIDHPLAEKTATHELVHSFIEGPQADLIYRGKVNLVNGTATVNIDTASTMTEGTFVALCRNVQCFTTNESDWTPVRGSVTENILTIEAQNQTSTASISWMVIGERQDKHMHETNWTDENGKVIVEPLKTIEKTAGDKA
jgi:hypothetical protein